MTLIEKAQKGMLPQAAKKIAGSESMSPKTLCRNLADGTAVIPKNKKRTFKKPCAIGVGLRTKVNANIGASEDCASIKSELTKLRVAEEFGADAVMDLSTSPNLKKVRSRILENANIPLGTVPIYETAVLGRRKYGSISAIPESFFLKTIESQAREGVDFFTIHAGVTRQTVKTLKQSGRVMGIVSRGGAILLEWMENNAAENPLYRFFDEILSIARDFDLTLSLGDGMRPGAIVDATDQPQIEELLLLGRLQQKALRKGVQVIIEGPGHVPLDQIKPNVELQKLVCNNAPFYVLGPVVTDIAPGYDHITGAIGGALAAGFGADFLCYVTPAEHIRLPTIEDVKEGVVATKIAAHAGDIAKKVPGAIGKDRDISLARSSRNWKKQFELAIAPKTCAAYRKSSVPALKDACTMCSEYCSLRIGNRYLKKRK